ncbi:LuxR family two component transcriptional regulator [Deinococcus aerius]|uniref:LuxR family two component transcriptional regulator n=1 Tax=Deinococcus aerius TaxID=200253 RepID=A0A2I9DNQ1_9DEIO|nr:LuxR family two component transcriptional regulator [Deinococcus aerius]
MAALDIGLPGMDGIRAAAEIAGRWPEVRIVMLTAHDLRDEVFAALAPGADAYCLKNAAPELLFLAIRAAAGSAYLDPQVAHHVLGGIRVPHATSPLTPRETEVLRLIADGQGNRKIAQPPGISVSTVKLHVQDILVKLRAADRTQVAVQALRRGLL